MDISVKQFKEESIPFHAAPVGVPMYIVGKPDRVFMKIKLEGSHGSSFMLADIRTGVVVPEHTYTGVSLRKYKTHSLNLEL